MKMHIRFCILLYFGNQVSGLLFSFLTRFLLRFSVYSIKTYLHHLLNLKLIMIRFVFQFFVVDDYTKYLLDLHAFAQEKFEF